MFDNKLLRAELLLCGISRKNLAEMLGIAKSTLSKKINGKSEWTLTELQKIGNIIGKNKLDQIFLT